MKTSSPWEKWLRSFFAYFFFKFKITNNLIVDYINYKKWKGIRNKIKAERLSNSSLILRRIIQTKLATNKVFWFISLRHQSRCYWDDNWNFGFYFYGINSFSLRTHFRRHARFFLIPWLNGLECQKKFDILHWSWRTNSGFRDGEPDWLDNCG